jgi:hypothetical protein
MRGFFKDDILACVETWECQKFEFDGIFFHQNIQLCIKKGGQEIVRAKK